VSDRGADTNAKEKLWVSKTGNLIGRREKLKPKWAKDSI